MKIQSLDWDEEQKVKTIWDEVEQKIDKKSTKCILKSKKTKISATRSQFGANKEDEKEVGEQILKVALDGRWQTAASPLYN